MKKLLLAEIVVLVLLVVVAVLVRAGAFRTPAEEPEQPDQSQLYSEPDGEDGRTDPPTDPPTEPPTDAPVFSTEPEHTLPPTEPEGPGIPAVGVAVSAKRYFVYDMSGDRFLAISGSENNPVYPASITKLFSAYVALQYLDPETVITAGDELDLVHSGSSLAYIQKEHRLTVDMLVEAMMLPSGNDAAYILAAAAAKAASGQDLSAQAAIDYFVAMMNRFAKDVGMTGSHFCNPDGFHVEDHYTSCHDLTIIARLALSNETISHYAAMVRDDVVYESGQIITWKNTNALINPDSKYYVYNAIGLKTGSTGAAGNCLLSAFREADGSIYIIGVFGCEESNDRFVDTRQLYWCVVHG